MTPKQRGKNAAKCNLELYRTGVKHIRHCYSLCEYPENTPAQWDWLDGYLSVLRKHKIKPRIIVLTHPVYNTVCIYKDKIMEWSKICELEYDTIKPSNIPFLRYEGMNNEKEN